MMLPVPLTPESKTLIERLLQERNAAQERLDVAVVATKAALGVPPGWDLRSLEVGFEEVTNDSNN
jgi:hypothetical protein